MKFDIKQMNPESARAIEGAERIAFKMGHKNILKEHLFLSLTSDPGSLTNSLLLGMNLDIETPRKDLERKTEAVEATLKGTDRQTFFSGELIAVLEKAQETAAKDDETASPYHLFLELVGNPAGEGPGFAKYVSEQQLNKTKVKEAWESVKKILRVKAEKKSGDKTSALEFFGSNLTQMAVDGKLDPVIGREQEIRRIMQILQRKTKNNPALIGEPGVGKTAIVEGLAQRLARNEVPGGLLGCTLWALNLSAVRAGTSLVGSFEERVQALIKEVQLSKGRIILFIDEMHMIGSRSGSVGHGGDLANMLKPALARGELRCIGATTPTEYRTGIETDSALERRFQPVKVEEPTQDETLAILRGLKFNYEVHHRVRIQDSALRSAVQLSSRYIMGRFLPDKAIDLLDEAAARVRVAMDSKPHQVEILNNQIERMAREKTMLENEPEDEIGRSLDNLIHSMSKAETTMRDIQTHWAVERKAYDELCELQKTLQAETKTDTGEMTKKEQEKHRERLVGIRKKIVEKKTHLDRIRANGILVKENVSSQEIAEVLADWNGTQATKLLEDDVTRLLKMEDFLRKRVVGQEEAVKKVSDAVRRNKAGFADPRRPLGSFIFVGPTGVGKTELAKALAENLFGDEKSLIRFDMSEYSEPHTVLRLMGAPPSYVGHHEGGALTEAVRKTPYCVLLFDEMEKAHKDVFNAFLQILDDGRLTDGKGKTIDFRNTLILMTSNLGSKKLAEMAEDDEVDTEVLAQESKLALKNFFRPEFLNRVDEIICFKPLGKPQMGEIANKIISEIQGRMSEKEVKLLPTPKALEFLAAKGFDPAYGARPLRRLIQTSVVDEASRLYLETGMKEGLNIEVDVDNGQVILRPQEKEAVSAN